jgi:hypothetical protein
LEWFEWVEVSSPAGNIIVSTQEGVNHK